MKTLKDVETIKTMGTFLADTKEICVSLVLNNCDQAGFWQRLPGEAARAAGLVTDAR